MGTASTEYDEEAQSVVDKLNAIPSDVAACGLVLGSLCSASALVGNALIVVAFLSDRSLKQRQNTFVVSAAIMEMALVFIRDSIVLRAYNVGGWPYGEPMKYFSVITLLCRNGFAVGHLVAITVYRYVLIVHPNVYKIMSKVSVIVLTLAVLFFIPVASSMVMLSHRLIFNSKVMFCIKEEDVGIVNGTLHADEVRSDNYYQAFVYISTNSFVLIFCNFHIYVFIKRSSQRVAGAIATQTVAAAAAAAARRNTAKEAKFVKIMAIMFGTFVVSYYLLPILAALDRGWHLSHWVYLPFVIINWFSSSINWVIYSLTHSGFRLAVRRLLRLPAKDKSTEATEITQTGSA